MDQSQQQTEQTASMDDAAERGSDAVRRAESERSGSAAPDSPDAGEAPNSAIGRAASEADAAMIAEVPETDADAAGANAAADEQAGAAPAADSATPPPADLSQRIEAILLTNDRAVSTARLSEWLDGLSQKSIQDAIAALNELYERTERSFRIEPVAGGWKVLTLPAYAELLDRMKKGKPQSRLTPAAIETLAIVAYKQPILRVDIEAIRGVACGEVLRSLMDQHMVKIVGRAEQPGRPMLYGTTRQFLEVFGLASLKDLPNASELRPKS